MIVLGIETSGPVVSVALVREGVLLAERSHAAVGQAAESLLGLLEGVLSDAKIEKASLGRVALGIGPGSFVGLRVGLAFGSGIALGLGIDALGVGSLRAMARGFDFEARGGGAGDSRVRVAVVDARRGEYFVAGYDAKGECVLGAVAVPIGELETFVRERFSPEEAVVLGPKVEGFEGSESPFARLPHAVGVALLGAVLRPDANPPAPDYIREADAIRPNLPDSPLLLPRS